MTSGYRHSTREEAEKTLDSILSIICEGVWDWDAVSGRVQRSPGWYRMLGYDTDSMKPDVFSWENLIHPDDYCRVMAHFEAYISGKSPRYCIEYRCREADGGYRWIEDRGRIIDRDAEGKVLRMIGAHLDIHSTRMAQQLLERRNELLRSDNLTLERLVEERTRELEALNARLSQQLEQIQQIATRDKLTSVYNRHMFEELLDKELSRARRYARPMALILVDVDFFKQINDQYGHQTGDMVLRELAELLVLDLRESDIVARWGGEEFVVILPDTSCADAAVLAEGLRQRIAAHRFACDLQLTCSFGVTTGQPDESLDQVFFRIDQALYRAKELSRNNVQVG